MAHATLPDASLAPNAARTTPAGLRPLGTGQALLYFGIPAAVFSASILGLLPWMIRQGVSPFVTFNVTFGGPLALMLVAAIVAYRLEGRPWSMSAFRERMRLGRFDWRLGAWGLAIGAFSLLVNPVISPVLRPLAKVRLYTAPTEFTAFQTAMMAGGKDFLGVPAAGTWWLLVWGAASLIILNIFGEELWWRGYILPRQELANGQWAWMVNGVLWAAFHIFYHTTLFSFVSYIPGCCALAYVAQRTRSTWPGVIGHTIANIMFLVVLVRGVTGMW
jgi:membrane protease YdiL (CAAX protease family)